MAASQQVINIDDWPTCFSSHFWHMYGSLAMDHSETFLQDRVTSSLQPCVCFWRCISRAFQYWALLSEGAHILWHGSWHAFKVSTFPCLFETAPVTSSLLNSFQKKRSFLKVALYLMVISPDEDFLTCNYPGQCVFSQASGVYFYMQWIQWIEAKVMHSLFFLLLIAPVWNSQQWPEDDMTVYCFYLFVGLFVC